MRKKMAAAVWGMLPMAAVTGGAATKTHSVVLGPARRVAYVQPDATQETKSEETSTLKVRPLSVDERQREWTTGELHEITDRTYTIRRAMRINDALPTDAGPRWVWQPGPWLLVDRVTGHITTLHLPDFDPTISEVTWYRDYAAYCGTSSAGKGGLYEMVVQLGSRRPIVQKQIGAWPQADHFVPVCEAAKWQRLPLRVTMRPTAGAATTFDVVGGAGLVEENDNADEPGEN